jgi:outer membrane protein
MKGLKVFGLAVMFGALMATAGFSADLKVAYVDLAKVFDNYQKTKDFDAVLQKEGDSFQKERDAMVKKIQDAQSKLELMSEAQKNSMRTEIEKQKNDVIAFDREKRTELARRRDEKVKEILTEIQGIVSDIAKKEGYTYVLNDRVMIFGDPQFNITDEVMKTLNGRSKK